MAIKITIQSGEGLFKFKDSSINFFESRPKIYQLERYRALKEDQAKIPVIARNVETGDFLFQGILVDEIQVDGVTYETYEELSEALTPILFSKGGGSGGGGTTNVITEDSDTVAFTGNGMAGTPLKAEVKSDVLDYIPLTGTEVGKPVTGPIKFNDLDNNPYINLGFNPTTDETGLWYDNGIDEQSRLYVSKNSVGFYAKDSQFAFTPESFNVYSNSTPLFKGVVGSEDFSANYNDLTYVQKKYVDNPETLITVLNNADSTQLATIKGLLGIV